MLEDRLGEPEPSEDFIREQLHAAHLVWFKHLCVLGGEQQGTRAGMLHLKSSAVFLSQLFIMRTTALGKLQPAGTKHLST